MASGEQDFGQRCELCLASIQQALDAFDPDELEADLASGVLRIRFADGRHCIVNRQSAAQQIWLAEGASAWHFVFDPGAQAWTDTRNRGELRAILGEILTRRLGRQVRV
ncbi:MAG: iron donor protein CyaY [Planctomycetes bacterium]|nr:iron donor protein CyaY [Planctomycetota bacterium]